MPQIYFNPQNPLDDKGNRASRPFWMFLDALAKALHTLPGTGTVTHTGALTGNALVVGNSGSDVRTIASLGTTTTLLHGNAAGAPTFGAVSLTADVSGVLPVANGGSFVQRATVTLTNAQVKALPTTGILVVAAPGSGNRNRILAGTLISSITTAYTNVNATYADLHTETNSGANYMTYGPVNDSTTAPALTQLAQLFTASTIYDLLSPQLVSNTGYVLATDPYGTGDQDNRALYLKADNNGSGDFTGGNAANSLKAVIYYVVEAI